MAIVDSAGIDVGAEELVGTLSRDGQLVRRTFPNTPAAQ